MTSKDYIFYYEGDVNYKPGWYWRDETADMLGPFETKSEAYKDHVLYCMEVLGIYKLSDL